MLFDWKSLFLSTKGRIGRKVFWIGFVLLMVASLIIQKIPLVGAAVALLLFWPFIAIYAKRLHDIGHTAWLIVIPFIVLIVCGVLAALTGGAAVLGAMVQSNNQALAGAAGGALLVILFLVLPLLVMLGSLLWVGLARGDDEPNRFGPPPALLR